MTHADVQRWLGALRFDGHGRCAELVEYFMELPERLRTSR